MYLKGDSRATYGIMRDVMEQLNKTGIEDVMLGTDEIKTRRRLGALRRRPHGNGSRWQ